MSIPINGSSISVNGTSDRSGSNKPGEVNLEDQKPNCVFIDGNKNGIIDKGDVKEDAGFVKYLEDNNLMGQSFDNINNYYSAFVKDKFNSEKTSERNTLENTATDPTPEGISSGKLEKARNEYQKANEEFQRSLDILNTAITAAIFSKDVDKIKEYVEVVESMVPSEEIPDDLKNTIEDAKSYFGDKWE